MISIPAFLVWLSAIGVLALIGGLINSVYRIGVRVAELTTREADLRSHVVRLQGILYRINPSAFRSDE
jgi:hypothetical protein